MLFNFILMCILSKGLVLPIRYRLAESLLVLLWWPAFDVADDLVSSETVGENPPGGLRFGIMADDEIE